MAFKFDDDYEEYRKKRKKEEQEVRTQQAKQNFENYTNAKKQSMQEMSSAIQERNKKQEEAKKKREEELNKVNQEFRSQYPQTVSQNNKQQQKLPIANFTLTSKDEKESKIKRVDSTALFKLSNGAIDTRSEGKKTIDDIMAITGNVYESAKNVIPSSVEFINKVNEYATKKVGEKSVSNILGNNETAKIAGQVIGSKIGEQIHNNINPIADINNSINNEEVKKKREEKIQANISATSNPLAKKLAEISSSVGQNAIPMAVSMVNPIVGTALFITSAGGNYLNEAEKLGMSEGQSLAYATVMAGIEGGSESFISTKFINNAIKKVGLKGLSNEILHSTGINIGENFVQEWATEYIDEYAKSLISIDSKDDVWNALKGQGEYADWEGIHARALQSGIDGILSAVILNGASLGVTSAVDVVQGKSSDIQKAFNDSKKVVDMNEIKDGVGKAVQNSLKNEIMNVKNQPIPATQQIAQQENKTAQNGNIKPILPIPRYIYEKSDNVKVDNLRQDASKYWDNSEKTRNYINMLEKIIQDKNIDIRLDTNLTDSQGRVANGSYSNGVITINPNSTRAGEFIAIHELTHAIGTEQMRNIVQKYRESNAEFDTAVKSLLQNYNTTELTEEAMSDVAGQLFGNQEFINNLAQTEPSLFQKIYNEIKYLWHQFTGYKNQDQFINDLQYKWEQAYRSNAKLNETTNYSIQRNNNGKYIKVDTDQDIFNGIEEKDYNKIAKMYMQDYLKGNTKLSESDNATIGSKGINKYTNPKQQTKYMNEKMKLTPELKNVLEIAKKVQDSPPTKDTSKYPNWEYYKFNFELGGKNFEGLINIGIDKNGNKHFYEINKIHTTSNSYVSTNKSSSTDSINNSILPTQENVNTTKYSIQESENNSGSFSFDKNAKRYADLLLSNTINYNKRNNGTLNIEMVNDNELINQISVDTKEETIKQLGDNIGSYIYESANGESKSLSLNQQEKSKQKPVTHKEKQLDIIKNANPMLDDYHTGIRNVEDIKTFKETIEDGESFAWGDFSKEDAKKALKEGEITIYSSYPIKQGTFISTSKIQAEEYAGGRGKRVYSKTIPLDEVAWINGDEGQYAKVDKKYSLPTKEWQQYLEKNYKPTGTRTNLKDIKLPTKQNILPTQETLNEASINLPQNKNSVKNNTITNNYMQSNKNNTQVEKYNIYKKNILKGRAEEVNNLIKNKNETINEIEKQIKEKTELLNNKKDKTTKVANNLKMQIENLKQRKSKIENEYNSRIDRKFDKVTKDKINLETKKELGITRKEIQQNLLEDTGILNESLDSAQNISMPNMNRTDPIRLQEKVFGRELGTKINDMFFNKIKHNTANKTRFLNSERNDIKSWGIKARSFESEVLQKYTEKTYVTEDGKEIAYTNADLIKDIQNEETRNKIKKASEELRKKYDNYIETANEVLVGLGYDAIPKRKDYVRHFTELKDIFTRFGIPGKLDNALPTDINGITDTFRPGKNFFANAQRRHGNKTTYDAITGIDGYIEGISNLIYHTEDIQRLRALDKYIRESYGEKGFENLDNLSEEDKKIRIQKISENHLSNYVSWLTEYTNNLAGKKSGIDRSVEKLLGRNIYSALDTIKKQTGSNMTGFNIGSALTNFISITQGASKTKKLALLKGTASTIKNIFNNDGFVEKSDFLTNRFGSNRLSNNLWQKASNAGQVFMSATDYFSSNLIVRSKYYENLAKGMNKTEALKKADDFGARILGDRSQGATANVFNSKMLGILTQFQLEVNNQLDTMMHDTVQDFKITSNENGNLKASMGAVWTLGQMAVYQYAFNEIFQAVAGRRPAFDIIDIIKTALGVDDEDDEDTVKDNLQEASVKLIEALPFINLLSEDARIPIASAIPNPISIATGESKFKDEMSKLAYLLPPTGGSQVKKSIEGIKTVKDGGSYVINSKGEKELRFPVENANIGDYIKAGVLGKYALPLAEEYTNRDYKRLSAKQTKTYEESNLPYKQYLDYIDAELKTNEEKINYLESKEMTEQQRWGIYKNDLFSDTERKEDGGSQLKDAEHITSNGVSKREYIKIYNKAQKNKIDMPTATEYDEMKANNIKLNNYIDYKIKVKDLTEKKKQSKELTETQELKNTDKIQILLDSNYSNKEIDGIYSSYIKRREDIEYDVMTSTGINIKEYLKYKQQEFTSDKKDDGTLDGKTVSKSKQKKVIQYLNSMKIEGNQRLLLYAMQGYGTTSSQKSQLAQYVYNLKLNKDTKLELYNKFNGFKVYKDGRVQW